MSTLSIVILAVAVCVGPGFILSWVSGCKMPVAAGISIPVSFGIYGLAAWFYGLTPWRYTLTSVAILWAFFLLLALLWRGGMYVYYRRRPHRAPGGGDTASEDPVARWRRGSLFDPVWVIPAIGVVTGQYMIIHRALSLLGEVKYGIDNIYQGWDVHWHASVIRFIDDTGVASSTRMGELQNTETLQEMYYPTAWHAGGWVLMRVGHLDPIAATNITGLVLPGLLLPVCVAALAWRAVGNRGLVAQIAAALAAVIVPVVPALYPIGIYVGMWPYLAGVFMAGSVIAIFMSVPATPIRAFAAALGFTGLVETHPAAATLVVICLALWWLTAAVWRPARRRPGVWGGILVRLRDVAVLAATGIVGTVLLLPQILTGSSQIEVVSGFTAVEAETHQEAWSRAAELLTRHAEEFGPIWPLLWAAAAGGVILLLWRGNLWAPLFYGVSLAATAYSLLPFDGPWGDALEGLSSLHYNTGHRLVMPEAMMVVVGAAVACAAVGRLILLGPVKATPWRYVSAVLAIVAAGIGGTIIAVQSYQHSEEAYTFGLNAARADDRMVDDTDLKAFQWLARQPHAFDGHVFSNPAEGSGWMYAYNDLPAFFRHYLWPTAPLTSDTNALFWKTQLLGAGNYGDPDAPNAVDVAARRLKVNFIYVSPPSFWAFQLPLPSMENYLWDAPGVTPVYVDKQVRIFAINEAFTDEELEQMRAPGNSPGPLPPLVTRGDAGVATGPEDADVPYFHRPREQTPTVLQNPYEVPYPGEDTTVERNQNFIDF
ncbi:hypothetical protein C1Y63_05250 [Corynebacterium sp. 13CS0277]|uniref:DUF6541 family protein n=1 Tax=Corynebacterium sp. 13CS0277 TaxID=2071994 RepID=UPI000D022A2F|nr:DUF6541 family protein [Corynebacterium sp. 13CS0277]PRQ11588.1 hypothetical protein C1Y63_05250 [Corynebacterium sp. 13CS0277]